MLIESIENELWEKELWTQKEVANYFRVVQGTVKNWRDQGFLSYWQAPGSSKILYYRYEIEEFRDQNSTLKKGGGASENKIVVRKRKEKPSESPKKIIREVH
jgi:hypothetical protein